MMTTTPNPARINPPNASPHNAAMPAGRAADLDEGEVLELWRDEPQRPPDDVGRGATRVVLNAWISRQREAQTATGMSRPSVVHSGPGRAATLPVKPCTAEHDAGEVARDHVGEPSDFATPLS